MSDVRVEAAEPDRRLFSAYTALSLATPTLIGVLVSIVDAPAATWVWLAVAVGILATAYQQVAWLVSSDHWPSRPPTWLRLPRPFLGVPALTAGVLVGGAVAVYGIGHGRPAFLWTVPGAAALGVLALALTHWEREVPRWPTSTTWIVLSLGTALAGAAEVAAAASGAEVAAGAAALTTAVIVVVVLVVEVGQVWWARVVTELTAARESLVSTALMEERLRFAGELHDLQGHELQVIMLQADVGRTTLRVKGPEAVEEAIATFERIRTAAAATMAQTREIAHGYRRAGFAQEVANTQPILAAAGIEVEVEGPVPELDGDAAHLAGLLVREATTNVLRHSTTDSVRITVRRTSGGYCVTILDRGPRRERTSAQGAPGSGLRSLAERARRLGYRIRSGPQGPGWQVTLEPAGPTP